MSKEDEWVNDYIETENNIGNWESDIEPEAYYEHYGTRGFVDLYVQRHTRSGLRRDYVAEVKSDSAVKNATGANEIIRQFNRMREAFYKSERRKQPYHVTMELVFTITPAAVFHVAENLGMYTAAGQTSVLDVRGDRSASSRVCFRPFDFTHAKIRLENVDGEPAESIEDWVEYLKSLDWGEDGEQPPILLMLADRYEIDLNDSSLEE